MNQKRPQNPLDKMISLDYPFFGDRCQLLMVVEPAAPMKNANTAPRALPLDAPAAASERVFFKIAGASTALGLAVLLGSVQAVRISPSGVSFTFTLGTLVAIVCGAVFGWLPWRLAASGLSRAGKTSWLFRASAALVLLSGIAGCLYPLRFVPAEKLPEVLKGLIVAVCVLSTLAFVLWRLRCFLERDAGQSE
jgi:hypothetical protein